MWDFVANYIEDLAIIWASFDRAMDDYGSLYNEELLIEPILVVLFVARL